MTVVAATSEPLWDFYFDGPPDPGKRTLPESELSGIEIVEAPESLSFDGDPVQFRLGLEARRIRIAFAYEMAAVAVSNTQPLPHQLDVPTSASSANRGCAISWLMTLALARPSWRAST
jgi:hypothetical protein